MRQTNIGDIMRALKNTDINNERIKVLLFIIVLAFAVIIIYFSKLILFEGEIYSEKLSKLTNIVIYGDSSPRGRIYDRNHKLLVDNRAVSVIVYNKNKKNKSSDEIKLAYELCKNVDIDYSKISITNLKEFWIEQNKELSDKKISEEEWIKLKNRKLNMEDIKNLKMNRITDEDLSVYNDTDKKAAYVYYLMNKGYSYQRKIIKSNVSDKEYAYIAEHKDELGGFDVSYSWERYYVYGDTFRSILGNVSNISYEDKKEYLSRGYVLSDIVGVSYLEKQYEEYLKGKKATYKLEDGNLKLISEGSKGNDIVLSIDIDLQREVEKILSEEVVNAKKQGATEYYNKSYVVIQDPNTGEILAMSGKQVVKSGKEYKVYDVTTGILTNPMTPGSVVKGASMMVGYTTGAIKIGEYMNDSCIKIYMKPQKCSWTKLGRINDINALANSSNIYQFKTAMKVDNYKYTYNGKWKAKESTFNTYRSMFNKFGLGVKTGIDLPVESVGNIGNNYSSDLLLNFSIGQYDTYTPIQLSQYITTIASNGNRLKPHLLKEVYSNLEDKDLLYKTEPVVLNKLDVDSKYLDRIKEGFIAVVKYGTGKSVMGSIDKPSGKTGTSESFLDTDGNGIVDTETLSNAFVGYAPYDNPVMTITVTSPDLVNPKSKSSTRSYANHRITRRISEKFFQLYNNS